jgi:hypothetical protein
MLTIPLAAACAIAAGCGGVFAPAPLFTTPLSIEGEDVGPAIIDTGGDYEVILRETFGLEVIGEVDVLAFGGVEQVEITRGFDYSAGGFEARAATALVGISSCDCNGIGFQFFRKHRAVLAIDFPTLTATFTSAVPVDAVRIPFRAPPPTLPGFDSSFIDVEVTLGGETKTVIGLVDTGTNRTLMRREVFLDAASGFPGRLDVAIQNEALGKIAVNVGVFSTPSLPDIILGTDAMRAWGDRWYFTYYDFGGYVAVVLTVINETNPAAKAKSGGQAASRTLSQGPQLAHRAIRN